MKNLYNQLLEDEKYQQILAALSDEERDSMNKYLKEYMEIWQNDFFAPLEELMKEKDFVDAISNKMGEVIGNNKE